MRNPSSKNLWLAGMLVFSIIFRIAAALYMGDQVVNLPGTFD